MKKILFFLFSLFVLGTSSVSAQVAINNDGSLPDPSAMLDVSSDDKGFLPPRVNSVVNDIQNPHPGLIAYQLLDNVMYYYNGSEWVPILNGENQIYDITVHVTSSEILNYRSSPKDLVPAPGPGKYVHVESIYAWYKFGTVGYDLATSLYVYYNLDQFGGVLGGFSAGSLLIESSSSSATFNTLGDTLGDIENKSLKSRAINDSGTGDGDLYYDIIYMIRDKPY